jgi:hypothetical protein
MSYAMTLPRLWPTRRSGDPAVAIHDLVASLVAILVKLLQKRDAAPQDVVATRDVLRIDVEIAGSVARGIQDGSRSLTATE